MPSPSHTELLAAYHRTRYTAETPLGLISLRIGEHNPLLDALLADQGCRSWAYLTAWNPGSRVLPIEENRRRQQALEDELSATGHVFYRGAGIPDPVRDSHWTPEDSLLIPGIDPAQADQLAHRFGQLAYVHGWRGGVPRLAIRADAAADR